VHSIGNWQVSLQSHQAISLLKEINVLGFADPSAVYVRENKGQFELGLKVDCSLALQNFVANKNLKWRERKDMDVCIIYSP
jgi:hypothetical protein